MENKTKFSIIVPVYNVEKYLDKCVESVLQQTFGDFQLILVDDGSTDSSGAICDSCAAKDSRVAVIHQQNGGLSAARNTGVAKAEGEYIIFLDSDDYWKDKNVLSDIADRLEKNRADVLSFDYVKFAEDTFENPYFNTGETMPSDTENTLKYQTEKDVWIACAWNKAVKRSLFEKHSLAFKSGITSEDIDWCLRLALAAESFDYLDRVAVCYRQRRSSISKATDISKTDILLDNIDCCLDIMDKCEDKEKAKHLRPYVAYQYGTAVYIVSTIKDKSQYRRLVERLEKNRHLLAWSDNRKVKLLRKASDIGGFGLMMFMLKIREIIRNLYKRTE